MELDAPLSGLLPELRASGSGTLVTLLTCPHRHLNSFPWRNSTVPSSPRLPDIPGRRPHWECFSLPSFAWLNPTGSGGGASAPEKPPCTAALPVTTVLLLTSCSLLSQGPPDHSCIPKAVPHLPDDPGRCHPRPPEPGPPPCAFSASCHQDLDSPVMVISPTTSCLTSPTMNTSPPGGGRIWCQRP